MTLDVREPRSIPIPFSALMVRAILSGAKTQTRRIVADRLLDDLRYQSPSLARCPYGAPGDRLWVRETWQDFCPMWNGRWCGHGVQADIERDHRPVYAATVEDGKHPARWKPSIHMPRWASRITLEVLSVRVERLQDISEVDAVAEGIGAGDGQWHHDDNGAAYLADNYGWYVCHKRYNAPAFAFRALWDQINGKRAPWSSNPWVWVIEFRRIKP